jgi:hypothetical protein
MTKLNRAPFETYEEYERRKQSGDPYSDAFIQCCRENAIKDDNMKEKSVRRTLLRHLWECVPEPSLSKVFDGIPINLENGKSK